MKLSSALTACSLMMASYAAAHAGVALAKEAAAKEAAAREPSVSVVYSNPDKFTDAGPYRGAGKERDRTFRDLTAYLERLGGKYLKPDDALTIEVVDLDLAGRVEPWRTDNTDIRVMRGVDWPGMTVRYTLTHDGATISQGEERIADLNYLTNSATVANSNDPLRFEKHMLDGWFRKRFGQR